MAGKVGMSHSRGCSETRPVRTQTGAYPFLLLDELLQLPLLRQQLLFQLLTAGLKPLRVLPSQTRGCVRPKSTWDGDFFSHLEPTQQQAPPTLLDFGALSTTFQGHSDLPAGWYGLMRSRSQVLSEA